MSEGSTPVKRFNRHRILRLVVGTAFHIVAATFLAAVFCWFFLNEAALSALPSAWSDAEIRAEIAGSLVIIVGLAACTWTLVVITSLLLRERRRQHKLRALSPARGTIITETLVVLPVFFLLTFGLAQMGINSMAGILGSVAVYEAARTVAVWGPEVGHNRSGGGSVTTEIVNDRARIAAAGILTPVVPNLASGMCATSQAMNQMQQGMLGALLAGGGTPQTQIWSFVEALDGKTSFAVRGVVKHRLAYCATTITHTGGIVTDPDSKSRSEFTTNLEYAHPAVFPLVGLVFTTDLGAGPWATPYVSVVRRSYRLTQQMSPNPDRPDSNAFRKLISNLPSPF